MLFMCPQAGSSSPVSSISGFSEIQDDGGKVSMIAFLRSTLHNYLWFYNNIWDFCCMS